MSDLNIFKDKDKLEIKDLNLEENKLIGWINKNNVGIWINHLRGLGNKHFNIEERKDMNPDHITLYHKNVIIGWIDRKYKKDIKNILWKYIKDKSIAKQKDKDKAEKSNNQLSLF